MFDHSVKELAKRQYVQDGWSIECIASHLRASPFTVKTWKEKGGWEVLRKEFVESVNNFSDEAFSFAVQTLKDIKNDFNKEERVIDYNKLKLLNTILGRIDKIILIDLERAKAAKTKTENSDIPEEVRNLPEVRKALSVIESAVFEFNQKRVKK
jgi:hypothetical protein